MTNGPHYSARSIKISDIKIVDQKDNLENIDSLAASIKKDGLIFPILLDKGLVLLDGQRRIAAYKVLGIDRIPAYVKE